MTNEKKLSGGETNGAGAPSGGSGGLGGSGCLTSKMSHEVAGTEAAQAASVTDTGVGSIALLGQFFNFRIYKTFGDYPKTMWDIYLIKRIYYNYNPFTYLWVRYQQYQLTLSKSDRLLTLSQWLSELPILKKCYLRFDWVSHYILFLLISPWKVGLRKTLRLASAYWI